MIRHHQEKQVPPHEFKWPQEWDKKNQWIRLSQIIPWGKLASIYYENSPKNRGRPLKEARLMIDAIIIKHKLNFSDRETVKQIQENPYLQYFVGFSQFQTKPPFSPTWLVEARKRMGQKVFDGFQQAMIDEVKKKEQNLKKRLKQNV